MIKRLLKNWLGITKLEAMYRPTSLDVLMPSNITEPQETPIDHEPVIVEKPVVKGYVESQ